MKPQIKSRALLFGGLALGFSGCATYPISKNLRQQAKPLTLAQVTTNPSAQTGTVVIWGGQVIKLPLDRDERPRRPAASTGRFIDPELFKRGRLITVAGAIRGWNLNHRSRPRYTYPVVGFDEVQLWHRRPTSHYCPGWYWSWAIPRIGMGPLWTGLGVGLAWSALGRPRLGLGLSVSRPALREIQEKSSLVPPPEAA